MKFTRTQKTILNCYIATILLAFTALFAKIIDLPVSLIIFGRAAICSCAIWLYLMFKNEPLKCKTRSDYFMMFVLGGLMGAHWLTYFLAIKLSTVAIGLIALYTFPVFTLCLEPFILKERANILSIIIAILIFGSMTALIPEWNWTNTTNQGLFWGTVSAILYAVRTIFSRKFITEYSGTLQMGYQTLVSTLVLLPLLLLSNNITLDTLHAIQTMDIVNIILLSTLFTALAHSLFLGTLTSLSAGVAGIITTLQPVIAILLAFLILNEVPSPQTMVIGVIILTLVFIQTTIQQKKLNYQMVQDKIRKFMV